MYPSQYGVGVRSVQGADPLDIASGGRSLVVLGHGHGEREARAFRKRGPLPLMVRTPVSGQGANMFLHWFAFSPLNFSQSPFSRCALNLARRVDDGVFLHRIETDESDF
jgi:hypothetical protein